MSRLLARLRSLREHGREGLRVQPEGAGDSQQVPLPVVFAWGKTQSQTGERQAIAA
jgi:hypothetical protein